jgi:hypothetical protein
LRKAIAELSSLNGSIVPSASTDLEAMAFSIVASGTGSSSGGDACHRSMGVIAGNVLLIIGDPARVRDLEPKPEDWIFCFWRRRAFANHVDMRFSENPVSADS